MMTILAATTALRATTQALDKDGRDPQRHYEYRVPIQSVAVVEVDVLTPTAQSEVYATAAQANDAELLALHEAIETSPLAIEALAESDADASEIIAANVDGSGTLILIANRGV
jgi:hypothetical protein